MKKLLYLVLFSLSSSLAAEHEIKMMTFFEGQPMIFVPAVLTVSSGDTVTFIPTQSGHQAKSHTIPDDAEAFISPLDEKFSVTLEKEGIYVYYCPPHRMMNMSGLIQVGKPVNRQQIDAGIAEVEAMATVNKGRLIEYLKTLDSMNAAPKKADNTEQPRSATTEELPHITTNLNTSS